MDYLVGNRIGVIAPIVKGQPRRARPKRLTKRDVFTPWLAEQEAIPDRAMKVIARRL